MAHTISLFAGLPAVLRRFRTIVPSAAILWLTPGAEIAILPLGDDVHDALHRACGTGDWLDNGPRLTTTDLALARDISRHGALAYIETDYGVTEGHQCAALWFGGELVLGPATMTAREGAARAPHLWPANAALRELGVKATPGADEFTAFGLTHVRSNADILTAGRPIPA